MRPSWDHKLHELLPPAFHRDNGEQEWERSRLGACKNREIHSWRCQISHGKAPDPHGSGLAWELLQLLWVSQALFFFGGWKIPKKIFGESVAGLIQGLSSGSARRDEQLQGAAGGRRSSQEGWEEEGTHTEQCRGRKLTDTPDGGPGRLVRPERGRSCFQTKERHASTTGTQGQAGIC